MRIYIFTILECSGDIFLQFDIVRFLFFALSPATNENIIFFNLRMFGFENVRPAANENARENIFHDLNLFNFFKLQPLPLMRMFGDI